MDEELIIGKPSERASKAGVVRHKRGPVAPLCRYYPYSTGSCFWKVELKYEVMRLGLELSVSLAESMFLLCDDICTMLCFCLTLWRNAKEHLYNSDCPVLGRLLLVIHYVYSKDIKDKNKNRVSQSGGGGKSVQWELVRTTCTDFADGIIILHRLVYFLTKHSRFDDRLLSSAIEKCKQVVKKLEDKLRSAEDVSKANRFVRETIVSNIFYLWKPLFDVEAGQATPKLTEKRILRDLLTPLLNESRQWTSSGLISHGEIPVYSPDVLGMDFAKQELKEEAVRLGVELSLCVAQSMYLLCDDNRSMLLFCFHIWRDAIRYRNRNRDSLVLERLLRAIHYVYFKDIKPRNIVYEDGGRVFRWTLIRTTWKNFADGIQGLHDLVLLLRGEGSYIKGREFTSSIEEALKKVAKKLRCVKAVSEANGFERKAIESNILVDLWKSVFDKEAKEATQTLKVINNGILSDLFRPIFPLFPILNEAGPPPSP